MKTSDLVGPALDWAVAKALMKTHFSHMPSSKHWWSPSTNWNHGGPIIEREWLHVSPWPNESDEDLRWSCAQHDSKDCLMFGPTPLVAAMRCFIASKLGDEVEIPKDLL